MSAAAPASAAAAAGEHEPVLIGRKRKRGDDDDNDSKNDNDSTSNSNSNNNNSNNNSSSKNNVDLTKSYGLAPAALSKAGGSEPLSRKWLSESFFDPFATDGDLLARIACDTIWKWYGAEFRIPREKLDSFVGKVQRNYRGNAYHSFNHGVHVLVNSARFVGLTPHVPSEDGLALLLASVCHDLDHVGCPNAMLVKQNHEFVKLHGDKSPLEKQSLALALQFLDEDDSNVLCNVPAAQQKSIRECISELILATDISRKEVVAESRELWEAAMPKLASCVKHHLQCDRTDTIKDAADNDSSSGLHNGNGNDNDNDNDNDQSRNNSTKQQQDVVRKRVDRKTRTTLLRMVLLCSDVGIVCEPWFVFMSGVRQLHRENVKHTPQTVGGLRKGQRMFLETYANSIFSSLAQPNFLVRFQRFPDELLRNRDRWLTVAEDDIQRYFFDTPDGVMNSDASSIGTPQVATSATSSSSSTTATASSSSPSSSAAASSSSSAAAAAVTTES